MKAMILAAGRGERMKPLTDTCPKPLLTVADKPLIEYHIEKLAAVGVQDIVINHAWLGQQLIDYMGDGDKWQVNIHYSAEPEGALETAGGIHKVLNLLGPQPFIVINGDVFTGLDFQHLVDAAKHLAKDKLAHLYLVANPEHNLNGDFTLQQGNVLNLTDNKAKDLTSLTYAGIGIYRPEFFQPLAPKLKSQRQALGPLLRAAAECQQLSGSQLMSTWYDIGTPARLAALNTKLNNHQLTNQ